MLDVVSSRIFSYREKALDIVSKNEDIREGIKTLFSVAFGHIFSYVFLRPVIISDYNLINNIGISIYVSFVIVGIYCLVLEKLFDFETTEFLNFNIYGLFLGTILGAYIFPF